MVETDEHAPDTVVAVMQKGYLLNDRLLRPALVAVAKAPGERDAVARAALNRTRSTPPMNPTAAAGAANTDISEKRPWARSSVSTSAPPTRALR